MAGAYYGPPPNGPPSAHPTTLGGSAPVPQQQATNPFPVSQPFPQQQQHEGFLQGAPPLPSSPLIRFGSADNTSKPFQANLTGQGTAPGFTFGHPQGI